jgi:hypothetical protein
VSARRQIPEPFTIFRHPFLNDNGKICPLVEAAKFLCSPVPKEFFGIFLCRKRIVI